MGQMLFPSSVPDTELVLYPLQDKLTSREELGLICFQTIPPILQSLVFRAEHLEGNSLSDYSLSDLEMLKVINT
ncbi:hypothetical protein Tco_0726813 [Tanacetum coccineum]|uniref:Uncharacterized protein n=1 Tax=Tanacetum coccineum TaxID=301880 RepID=A0ABQ4YJ51_9ASTR